jgi:BirA family biotin operon repressor/biotin-[acetyl-CoA-carboxylase] ligase
MMVCEGFGRIVPLWEKWDGFRGRQIRVRQGAAVIEGRASGIDAEGRLRLETATGVAHIVAGDVSVLDGYRDGGDAGRS